MNSVRKNRTRASRIGKGRKGDTAREFVLLCCVILFSLPLYSSLRSSQQADSTSFTLHPLTPDSLSIVKKTDTKGKEFPGSVDVDTPAHLTPFFFQKIPINYCDKALLQSVSGIGPQLAENILHTRERIGAFSNQQDLLQVSGIGVARMTRFGSAFNFTVHQ